MNILSKSFIKLKQQIYSNDIISIYIIASFILLWTSLGNIISISYVSGYNIFIDKYNLIYLLIYITPILLIFFALLVELSKITIKYSKIIIICQLFLFFSFALAPPRNADSMRVWLAKIYDIIINGEKILRPYAHYNTPDAFTLYHLPVIQIWDGQLFQLSIFACYCSILILLIKITKFYTDKHLSIIVCIYLFIFNPLITLGATVIISDMPLILSFAGITYSLIYFNKENKTSAIILLYIFLSFGLNVKYNALMIIPALIYWSLTNIRINNLKILNKYNIIILLFVTLNSVYPYFLNYVQIGNPVWPVLSGIFPSHFTYFDIPANTLTNSFLKDEINITNLFTSFFHLLTMPHHINPLVILLIPFLFQRFKYISFMPLIIVSSYVFILWIMMPKFGESEKERYFLYLFPILIPFGVIGFNNIFNLRFNFNHKKTLRFILIVPFSIYFAFNLYYSKDSIHYLIVRDLEKWHKHTWYYNDYQWINNNISLNLGQQIMVSSSNQLTYYLRKRYINIDQLSGYFKNPKIFESTSNYLNEIKKFNISYIFVDYDDLDSSNKAMLNNMYLSSNLIIIRKSTTFLSISRLFNRGNIHNTVLYKVNI